MTIASAVPTLMLAGFATLAVTGVVVVTVKVELTAQRFEAVKRSLARLSAGALPRAAIPAADNAWLTKVVSTFDD